MAADQPARLEQGHAHRDAQGPGLVGACDDASVIVGQHDHRAAFQAWVKGSLAGNEEVVAIDKGEDLFHGLGRKAPYGAGDHTPDAAFRIGADLGRRVVRVFGLKLPASCRFDQTFDRKLATDNGDDDMA